MMAAWSLARRQDCARRRKAAAPVLTLCPLTHSVMPWLDHGTHAVPHPHGQHLEGSHRHRGPIPRTTCRDASGWMPWSSHGMTKAEGFSREGGVVIGKAAGLRKAAAPVLTLRATQTLRHAMA